MSARIRTVLLDLDGTLIDSTELILASFRHTLRAHREEAPPDAEWLETMGRPLRSQLRAFARDEAETEAMMETYREHNLALHDELLRPFPGVREYVERLGREGFRLAVVTSKLRDGTLRGLRACGYRPEWFAAVVTASDVRRHKPHPEPVRAALAGAGESDPARSLFVGDSVWDMRAGRAAGTRTAAALWGPYDRERLEPTLPDYWLERVDDLDAVLAGERVR